MFVFNASASLPTTLARQLLWPDGPSLPLEHLFWGMGIVGAGLLLWWAWSALGRLRKRLEPWRLFNQVAGRFGLSWSEKMDLYRIARQQRLQTPLTLMICDQTLRHHVDALLQTLPPDRALQLDNRAQRIAAKLFGESTD
jgi:hypothetical protein